ncbi:hypothetical protein GA707_07065 [Nostocoides sp. F2B08]|uniref:sunset domain-containing protein n=1 Tax=Nostocoides sp. F2B08 TaxID=2653936 RepID=UPI0012636419|nr:hypothetical protein [Tetrasphaera sp. F2B08]KAB7745656.1 hypothetical protein GA707_07065 [Tetrasphaera sp. F2B08]
MWFKKDKDSNGEDGDSSTAQDAVDDDGMSGVTEGASHESKPTDRVGEQPIDAETGAYSDELSQALEDARGADEGGETDPEDYESRHAGGVDDSGVLADAPDDTSGDGGSGGGSVLPRDGALTDESAVEQTPEAAAAEEGEALRDSDPTDSLEQDAGTDADREQREAEQSQDEGQSQDENEDPAREEAERREREEAFAREHDPTDHDLGAGEEFRQRGDWTADEHGGPQVQEPDGTVHEPDDEGTEGGEGGRGGRGSGESALEDVRDGGHGWGSAAPVEGGAQPLGHPVKAWHDTMTYVLPGEPGYEADPHEWFVDGETAERAGFRPAHGG